MQGILLVTYGTVPTHAICVVFSFVFTYTPHTLPADLIEFFLSRLFFIYMNLIILDYLQVASKFLYLLAQTTCSM